MVGYLYILRSLRNGSFYIGSTNDLERRIAEHNIGKNKYTKLNKPFELIFYQEYDGLVQARKAEYWLKKQKDKDLINRVIEDGKLCKLFG